MADCKRDRLIIQASHQSQSDEQAMCELTYSGPSACFGTTYDVGCERAVLSFLHAKTNGYDVERYPTSVMRVVSENGMTCMIRSTLPAQFEGGHLVRQAMLYKAQSRNN